MHNILLKIGIQTALSFMAERAIVNLQNMGAQEWTTAREPLLAKVKTHVARQLPGRDKELHRAQRSEGWHADAFELSLQPISPPPSNRLE